MGEGGGGVVKSKDYVKKIRHILPLLPNCLGNPRMQGAKLTIMKTSGMSNFVLRIGDSVKKAQFVFAGCIFVLTDPSLKIFFAPFCIYYDLGGPHARQKCP